MIRKLKKAWLILRRNGRQGLYRRVLWHYRLYRWNKVYQRWIQEHDTLSEDDCRQIKLRIGRLSSKPLISVLMPVYNVEETWLRKAIESVVAQIYPHWEFCIADDASTKPHIRKVLEEYAAKDERIKVVFREQNGHISAASNSALELATGEFTALLDHDDELSKHALYLVAEEVNSHPETEMIYSDEDMIDSRDKRSEPKFKPDWSPDLFYSLNLITHLSVYRTSTLRKVGGLRIGAEGSQDYDLALRITDEISPSKIRHIPYILYHWRAISGSVALSSDEKPYAHARARQAIEAHFGRKGIAAKSIQGYGELHRAVYDLPNDPPLVSIITTDGHLPSLLNSLFSTTDYKPYEIIIITRGPENDLTSDKRVQVIDCNGETHYSSLNIASRKASGSVLCFIDGSTIVRSGDWLRELVSQAIQQEIGAVGAKIFYPGGKIKHAGLITGIRNNIGRAHYKFHKQDMGNFMRLHVTQNFAAVSAECLTIRKEVFDSVCGFDAENFPSAYGDVDLCLRLLEKGYRNVWTPWAELIQSNEPAEGNETELARLREKWTKYFVNDPYFNPNFSNESDDFTLSFPPRTGKFSL
ncbi:MAG: glycosyltransferase [Saprospiraceae bacterium]|nr:glycosyltransferase [Pyrinomonadaceae bacterium]